MLCSPALRNSKEPSASNENATSTEAWAIWRSTLRSNSGSGNVTSTSTLSKANINGSAIRANKAGRKIIAYGPAYLLSYLDRLRRRNVQAKRNLALREFALGPRASNAPWPGQPRR